MGNHEKQRECIVDGWYSHREERSSAGSHSEFRHSSKFPLELHF